MAELHSVVAYLRKEHEIGELHLELSKQENIRLKSQIEHLSKTLQETKDALTEVDAFPCWVLNGTNAGVGARAYRQRRCL